MSKLSTVFWNIQGKSFDGVTVEFSWQVRVVFCLGGLGRSVVCSAGFILGKMGDGSLKKNLLHLWDEKCHPSSVSWLNDWVQL